MTRRFGHLVRFDAQAGVGEIRATDGRLFSMPKGNRDVRNAYPAVPWKAP